MLGVLKPTQPGWDGKGGTTALNVALTLKASNLSNVQCKQKPANFATFPESHLGIEFSMICRCSSNLTLQFYCFRCSVYPRRFIATALIVFGLKVGGPPPGFRNEKSPEEEHLEYDTCSPIDIMLRRICSHISNARSTGI